MSDGRFVSRSIVTDRKVHALRDYRSKFLFTTTIPHLDRDGRISGDPLEFLALVAPMDRSISEDDGLEVMEDFVRVGLAKRYVDERGQWVLWFPGFTKNQRGMRYDREAPSKFGPESPDDGPAPDQGESSPDPDLLRTYSGPTPDSGGDDAGALRQSCGSPPASMASESGSGRVKLREVKLREVHTSTESPSGPDEPVQGEQGNSVRVSKRAAEVQQVFDVWLNEHVEPSHQDQAKLNTKRRRAIEARLREGYTADRLIAAIRGVKRSPYHMGENESGTKYTDLVTVLRDGAQVEKFEGLAAGPPRRRASGFGGREEGGGPCLA